jgi:hypothetical protein
MQNSIIERKHIDRDEKNVNARHLHQDICVMLDFPASKMRCKNGEPREEDCQVLKQCIIKLHELTSAAK